MSVQQAVNNITKGVVGAVADDKKQQELGKAQESGINLAGQMINSAMDDFLDSSKMPWRYAITNQLKQRIEMQRKASSLQKMSYKDRLAMLKGGAK